VGAGEGGYRGGGEGEVSPYAGQHALLIFVAMFGAAAIWFGSVVAVAKWRDGKDDRLGMGRIYAFPGALVAILFAIAVLSFWR
jgi:hypothetical protein